MKCKPFIKLHQFEHSSHRNHGSIFLLKQTFNHLTNSCAYILLPFSFASCHLIFFQSLPERARMKGNPSCTSAITSANSLAIIVLGSVHYRPFALIFLPSFLFIAFAASSHKNKILGKACKLHGFLSE